MANVRNGNTFFVNQQHISDGDALDVKNIKATAIFITATAANGICELVDNTANEVKKLDLRVEISGRTEFFDLALTPVVFPNGIRVKTLTNAIATILVQESQS